MFENLKEAVRARVAPTSTHWATLRGDLQNRLQHFHAQRAPQAQEALEQDFAQVLQAWGIEDAAQLPAVLRELRLRLWVFALPVVLCLLVAVYLQSPAAWLTFALVGVPCLLGVLTTLWRVSVLARQRFQPFTGWLCSLVSFTKKGA